MTAEALGAQLRDARIEKEMSVEQVSRVLSIRPSLVTALEQGNYREIGALLYAKNYLRKYAKLLNLPQETFEQSLEALQESTDPRSQGFYETSKVKYEAEEKKRSNNFKYYLIFVLVLIALFAYFYQAGVIPSPFKGGSAASKDAVNLPNERLPSLELEYSLRDSSAMNEDITFEELLSESLREQQAALVSEYHEGEALASGESDQNGYEEAESHFVTLNKESEVLGDNFSNLAVGDVEKKKYSGRFDVLGAALRNYSPLLSASSLPLIDLGTKVVSGRFTAPQSHIQYFYGIPGQTRLGLELPKSLLDHQNDRFKQYVSIYDRESGFYPFIVEIIDNAVVKSQQQKLELLQGALAQKNEALVFLQESESLSQQDQRKIPMLQDEISILEENYQALQTHITVLQGELAQKDLIKIRTSDITTLDIQDTQGRTLASRVMRNGDEYQLDAKGIYDIYLGNPAVIDKITVNGKAIPEYYYRPLTEEAVSIRFSLNSELYR